MKVALSKVAKLQLDNASAGELEIAKALCFCIDHFQEHFGQSISASVDHPEGMFYSSGDDSIEHQALSTREHGIVRSWIRKNGLLRRSLIVEQFDFSDVREDEA